MVSLAVSHIALLLLIAYFVFLVAASLARRSHVPGRAFFLFRAFFPSWRFFEDIGDVPVLLYRSASGEKEWGNWEPCLKKAERKWGSLFLNPLGNHLLACGSVLQHLMSDLEEMDEDASERIKACASYELVRGIVHDRVLSDFPNVTVRYQFKVATLFAGDSTGAPDDVLISPVYEAGSEC